MEEITRWREYLNFTKLFRLARTISDEREQRTSEILFVPREHEIHIFKLTYNFLLNIWAIKIHGKG